VTDEQIRATRHYNAGRAFADHLPQLSDIWVIDPTAAIRVGTCPDAATRTVRF
jgi:hypothetical protein